MVVVSEVQYLFLRNLTQWGLPQSDRSKTQWGLPQSDIITLNPVGVASVQYRSHSSP